jgi:hypothetical protein
MNTGAAGRETTFQLPSSLGSGDDRSMFVIDEAYERYSWALNFYDDDRWQE